MKRHIWLVAVKIKLPPVSCLSFSCHLLSGNERKAGGQKCNATSHNLPWGFSPGGWQVALMSTPKISLSWQAMTERVRSLPTLAERRRNSGSFVKTSPLSFCVMHPHFRFSCLSQGGRPPLNKRYSGINDTIDITRARKIACGRWNTNRQFQ